LTASIANISVAITDLNEALRAFRGAYIVVWYKFDEAAGETEARDSSGNGYHAAMVNGASFTGTSAALAGGTMTNATGQHIVLPRNVMENVPDDFTISTWVMSPQNNTNQWRRVFDFSLGSGENIMFLTLRDFQFNMDNANAIMAPAANRPNNNLNIWQLVTITREGNMTRMFSNLQPLQLC